VRPQVCRACLPGDDACLTARRRFNLEHDPEKACRKPDPGRVPVSRLREALGAVRRLA
jgi:hypothetical protein